MRGRGGDELPYVIETKIVVGQGVYGGSKR